MTCTLEVIILGALLWGGLCFAVGMVFGAWTVRRAYERALRELRELHL